MEIWETIATERLRLADELEELTADQWATQSQCEAWDARHLAAHLLLPFEVSTPRFMLGVAMSGFSLDKFSVKATAKIAAQKSNAEIIQGLRDNAESRWTPPGKKFGPEIPLTEVLVHGQDIRRPLGIECPVPQETIDEALAAISDEKIRDDYRRRIMG